MKILPYLFAIVLLCSGCNHNTTQPPPSNPPSGTDPGYRVIIDPVTSAGEPVLPSPATDWTLQYTYIVPPEPGANWDYDTQTVYTYGQVDFDWYGSNGQSDSISYYAYNQIVPQVMIGNCLDSSDSQYNAYWGQYSDWVVQAQYYWMRYDNTSFSMCGNLVYVLPGDELITTIFYSASSGSITATISGPSGTSSLVIDRPFPNDTLFTSWREFFEEASQQSGTSGPYGDAALNVETHYLDEETICSMLPFTVNNVTIPGIPWVSGNYSISRSGSYTCNSPQANQLAILNF